ncbi:uncharacterized protein LOC129732394 [Wyeomyia smithii]|uniref:uncharacterized protein LOC129732394 n=1 Tax=Wyeomyia smithii TaxID=174621 RepID=UPI002467D248|nr:uncharacterized protein LOC129732394 [Wyeomyia smithii]
MLSYHWIVFLVLVTIDLGALALQCYRCKSTLSWSACAQNMIVEECTAEHPFDEGYRCVSNRMNLTTARFVLHIYSTGCGYGSCATSQGFFDHLRLHGNTNSSIEEWHRCEEDLCNTLDQIQSGKEQVAYVGWLLGGSSRIRIDVGLVMGIICLLGKVMLQVGLI